MSLQNLEGKDHPERGRRKVYLPGEMATGAHKLSEYLNGNFEKLL